MFISFILIKLAAVQARGDAYMKLQMFGTVGRATVPADIGRHGGRPYDSTRPKFLFRSDWLLQLSAAGLVLNIEYGVASLRLYYQRLIFTA